MLSFISRRIVTVIYVCLFVLNESEAETRDMYRLTMEMDRLT